MTDTRSDYRPIHAIIPGIDAWIPTGPATLTIRLTPSRPFTPSPTDERRWHAMCAGNPLLHDGRTLIIESPDPSTGEIACRIGTFREFCLNGGIDDGVPTIPGLFILGVKGWITARGRRAKGDDLEDHLLIARRNPGTRIYANLWECAPAGGVDPPTTSATTLGLDLLRRTLAEEAQEELGLTLDPTLARILAIGVDQTARSWDIILDLPLANEIDPRHSPRCMLDGGARGDAYTDTAWLARSDAPAYTARFAQHLVPPLQAMLRLTRWT